LPAAEAAGERKKASSAQKQARKAHRQAAISSAHKLVLSDIDVVSCLL
jgi:hypothetical protein